MKTIRTLNIFLFIASIICVVLFSVTYDPTGGHICFYNLTGYNEEYHWGLCECGSTINSSAHSYDTYAYDEDWHWEKCACGKQLTKERHNGNGNSCLICNYNYVFTPGVNYEVSADGTYAEVVGYSGTDPFVKMRGVYNNLPVKTIQNGAFAHCGLSDVEIPDSVTTIGDSAFYHCDSLTSVVIGDSVTTIGNSAFSGCSSLTSVVIPDSVTTIGDYAFYDCDSLTSITIPDSVTSIGDGAFSGCTSLTSITIPDSVTTIGDYAFYDCCKLVEVYNKSSLNIIQGSSGYGYVGYYAKAIYTAPYTSKLSKDNGYLIYTDGEEKILMGYTGEETDLTLPSYITEIYKYAFYSCDSLTSVVIGDSVTSIGNYAFYSCSSLTSVVIPDSVTSIGYQAFAECDSLTSMVISDSVTTIGDSAFSSCYSLGVYYKGTADDWANISIGSYDNGYLTHATRYYYIENEADVPTDGGNYWHYDQNGEIAIW